MSWHPSRIETRIKPTSRAPRCDYGSPTPLPEAIYRLGQVETQRRKDPVDFIEKTRFRARSGVGERAPSPDLWRRQYRPEHHRSGEFTFVDEAHPRHWGAQVEVSDTDSDDRKTEVQYDLASDQPVFYAFGELSRKGKRNSHPGGDGLSDNESAAVSGDEQETPRSVQQGSSVPGGKKHGAAAVYHVLESHYTGDGYAHGHHSAELKAILSERAVVPQSMFRWIHFTRPSNNMDMDDLSAQIASIPGLSSTETNGLQKMVTSIKRDFATTVQTSDGKYVRCLAPTLRFEPLMSEGKTLGSHSVTWIGLPYFSLEPYSGLSGTASPKCFATPTLLQTKYSRTTRNREMQQAVCQQKGVSPAACFHVSQLWCLILDNSLLLTYGRLTQEALCEGIITKTLKPLETQLDSIPTKTLLVRYKEMIVWSIPLEQCQTWFSFVSHFGKHQPRGIRFCYRGRAVQPSKWPKFIQLAARPNRKLMLDLLLRSPIKPPRSELPVPPGSTVVDQPTPADRPVPKENTTESEHVPEVNPALALGQGSQSPGIRISGGLAPSPKGRSVPRASLFPQPPSRDRSFSTSKTESACGIFAYLECFGNSPASPALGVPVPTKVQSATEYFAGIDEHMRSNTAPVDRFAYRSIHETLPSLVYEVLNREQRILDLTEQPSLGLQRDFQRRVSVYNSADAVFNFFFPHDTWVATTKKFWGAVGALVTDSLRASPRLSRPNPSVLDSLRGPGPRLLHLDSLATALGQIRGDVLVFGEGFTNIEESDRAHINPPPTLTDAWVHITLALATFPSDERRSMELIQRARFEIYTGMWEILGARSDALQVRDLMVLPSDLVALMSMKLMKNVTPSLPDISSTYGSYLDSISSEIATGRPDRRIDHKLGLFLEELSAIRWTVDNQVAILSSLLETRDSVARAVTMELAKAEAVDRNQSATVSRDVCDEPGVSYVKSPQHATITVMAEKALEPGRQGLLEPCGFDYMLVHDCIQDLKDKRDDLATMVGEADSLKDANDNKINRTKDRQENAIYAFTIVTVIFLPLSAVASVFGMNSADIRDMDAGQWVYWATALPVTAVVMLLGLVYTGEMRRLRAWVAERVAERVARWITSNTKGEWEPVNDRDREREKERERDWREVGRR